MPRGEKSIRDIFATFGATSATLVFFERKDRLENTLNLARDVLGDRACAICREITKLHEEFRIGALADTQTLCRELLGEITVIIGPPSVPARTDLRIVRGLLAEAIEGGVKPREAVRRVKDQVLGYSARELYELLMREGK